MAAGQPAGPGAVAAVVHHPGAAPAGIAAGGLEGGVVEGRSAISRGAAGRALGRGVGGPRAPAVARCSNMVADGCRQMSLDGVNRRQAYAAGRHLTASTRARLPASGVHGWQWRCRSRPLVGGTGPADSHWRRAAHAVKPGSARHCRRRGGIVVHDVGQLLALSARGRCGHRTDPGRWRHPRHRSWPGRGPMAPRVRRFGCRLQCDTPHMPELGDDFAALGMHGLGDFLPVPAARVVQAWHIGIALALLADGRGLGDQQTGAGALGVGDRHVVPAPPLASGCASAAPWRCGWPDAGLQPGWDHKGGRTVAAEGRQSAPAYGNRGRRALRFSRLFGLHCRLHGWRAAMPLRWRRGFSAVKCPGRRTAPVGYGEKIGIIGHAELLAHQIGFAGELAIHPLQACQQAAV